MTRSPVIVLGTVTGSVLALGFGVVAQYVGLDSDAAMGWMLVFLPMLLGVLAAASAVLTRRPDDHTAIYKASLDFVLAAVATYFVIEAGVIAVIGEEKTHRDWSFAGSLFLAAYASLAACLVSAVVSFIAHLLGVTRTDEGA